jgi:hypothetical protein
MEGNITESTAVKPVCHHPLKCDREKTAIYKSYSNNLMHAETAAISIFDV